MLKRTKLCMTVSAAFSANLIAVAPNALAQTQTTPAPQSLDRVEVTGSLIRRIEGETALPVTTISIEELQRAGVTNAEQAVKYIAQNQSNTVSSSSVSGTNGAASFADLRSLGSNRTLVLLNGKRVTQNPFAVVGVDLNTLPLAAVQRIETLSDGASATYGTDAIAGVINFITRKEYSGITVGAEAQIPEESGGEVYSASLLGGYGSLAKQGWNAYGSFNYRTQKPLGGTERDFMQTSFIPSRGFDGTSPTTFPANYTQGTTVATNPFYPGCFPPSSINTGAVGTRCFADTQSFTYVIPDQEQYSAFLRGNLALGPNNTLFAEYFYAFNKIQSRIAPSPEGGLTMNPNSPFYPGNGITPPSTAPGFNPAAPISIGWRTTTLGAREGKQENDTQRAVIGLEGSGAGWDYQANLLWSEAEVVNTFINGWPRTAALIAGVAGTGGAPFLNPFGPQTPQGQAYLEANTVLGEVQNGKSEMRGGTVVGSRQFFQLPGGPISVALLGEYREEEMVYNTDIAKVSQAASSGLAGSGAVRQGDRDIYAFGAELVFPVLKGVELGASVRYDHYSDFGSTTNPKFSIRYTPTDQILLRGSYNTGFAAPSLYNLYLPNSTTFTANRFNDPVLCPNGVPAPGSVPSRDCGIQFQRLVGGNAQLTPEESESYTLGFVLQPTASFSFGIDYWRYRITESISTIGEQTIFADPAAYASLFVRCSQAPADRIATIGACRVPGGDPLAYVIDTFQNLGNVKTSGFDFQASWNGPATRFGRFNIGARSTYIKRYDFQVVKNGQYFNPIGNYSPQFAGPVIRYQQITTLGWNYDAWNATLFNRYLSGYRDQNNPASNRVGFRDNRVQDYSVFDLGVTYTGFRGITLKAGIQNLLDDDPPYSNQTGRFQARGYDDRFYSPIGRVYTVGASYQF